MSEIEDLRAEVERLKTVVLAQAETITKTLDVSFATVLRLGIKRDKAGARIAKLLAQLPDGMKDCTIQFKECAKGHGWLTATNWIQHGCPTCEIERLTAALREIGDAADSVAHDTTLEAAERRAWRSIKVLARRALEEK